MAVRDLVQRAPAPWASRQGAVAFIDPKFPEVLGDDLVIDLLRVAGGQEVTSSRTVSDAQFKLIDKHRCVPLIPEQWTCSPGHREAQARTLVLLRMSLEATMKQVSELLREVDVEPVVLKGLATSRLDYAHPDLRHTGDIDLLIRPEQLSDALASLAAVGFTQKDPVQLNDEFLKGDTMVSSSGVEIDIHTRLTFVGGSLEASAFEHEPPIDGLGAPALPLELRLVHAASHLFFSPPEHRRMSGLADISAIRSSPALSLSKVRYLAAQAGLEASTFAGLAIESQLMGRNMSDLTQWEEPEGLLRLGYSRSRRNILGEQLFIASAQPNISARLRYLSQKTLVITATRHKYGGFLEYARAKL